MNISYPTAGDAYGPRNIKGEKESSNQLFFHLHTRSMINKLKHPFFEVHSYRTRRSKIVKERLHDNFHEKKKIPAIRILVTN